MLATELMMSWETTGSSRTVGERMAGVRLVTFAWREVLKLSAEITIPRWVEAAALMTELKYNMFADNAEFSTTPTTPLELSKLNNKSKPPCFISGQINSLFFYDVVSFIFVLPNCFLKRLTSILMIYCLFFGGFFKNDFDKKYGS